MGLDEAARRQDIEIVRGILGRALLHLRDHHRSYLGGSSEQDEKVASEILLYFQSEIYSAKKRYHFHRFSNGKNLADQALTNGEKCLVQMTTYELEIDCKEYWQISIDTFDGLLEKLKDLTVLRAFYENDDPPNF